MKNLLLGTMILLFALNACTIPSEEIEKVLDFENIEAVSRIMKPIILPLSPSNEIHIFFDEDCGGTHSYYCLLNEDNDLKHGSAFFSDHCPFDAVVFLKRNPFVAQLDQQQNFIYFGFFVGYGHGIFLLNSQGEKEFFYPFNAVTKKGLFNSRFLYQDLFKSIFLFQDKTLFFSDQFNVYRITYPLHESSTHEKIFDLRDLNLENIDPYYNESEDFYIRNIVFASNAEVMLVLWDSRGSPSLVRIDLDTFQIESLLIYQDTIRENHFIHTFIRDQWIVQFESFHTTKNSKTMERRVSLYNLEGQLVFTLSNAYASYSRYLTEDIKTTPNGTYLYWIDNFILYRWKVPIE